MRYCYYSYCDDVFVSYISLLLLRRPLRLYLSQCPKLLNTAYIMMYARTVSRLIESLRRRCLTPRNCFHTRCSLLSWSRVTFIRAPVLLHVYNLCVLRVPAQPLANDRFEVERHAVETTTAQKKKQQQHKHAHVQRQIGRAAGSEILVLATSI